MQKLSITGLAPSTRYLIYVAASLRNGKSLPYDVVRIRTSASCRHTSHHWVEEKYGDDDDDSSQSSSYGGSINWLERNNMIEDD